ncbi:MAG: hypothetical protein M3256_25495 [Actinomycetota bacterium]|nr:hypothetical protein [Actinomycetota bacterium]
MTSEGGAEPQWVISLLVTGDGAGVMAVSAEGLIKTTLWKHPDGSQPVASTVVRFSELSPTEQDDWRRLLQREAGDR